VEGHGNTGAPACQGRSSFGMRALLLLALIGLTAAADQEVKFAPAVVFRNVEWWGPGSGGAMWWFPGRNQTPYPADLGRIKEGRLVGPQEIEWLGRDFDIEKVVRTEAGDFVVTFDDERWKLVMGKTHEDRWLVDVFPPKGRFVQARFRTITKATAHVNGE
jgi:hypothetical protein